MSARPVELGNLVDIVMGQAPPGESCNKDGVGTVFVKAGEFQERHPVVREWTTKPLKLAKKDDALVCVVGATCGKVNQATFDSAIGRSVAAVRARPGHLDSLFLFQFLQTKVLQLRDKSQGAAQGVITREMLQSLDLILPPLPEQRRIAAILDQADALRAKRREGLAQLDRLTQSIFIEMFGDAFRNNHRIQLSDLIEEFRYGTSNKSGATGYPTLRIPNVTSGSMDLTELKTVEVEDAEFRRLNLQDGDLLFVRTNGNPDNVGRCAVFNQRSVLDSGFDASEFIYASYLIRARMKKNTVLPCVLQQYLSSGEGRHALRARSKTSAGQFNINTEGLGALPIPSFPMPLQEIFIRRKQAIEQQQIVHRTSLSELDALFASLQHRAFRGEL